PLYPQLQEALPADSPRLALPPSDPSGRTLAPFCPPHLHLFQTKKKGAVRSPCNTLKKKGELWAPPCLVTALSCIAIRMQRWRQRRSDDRTGHRWRCWKATAVSGTPVLQRQSSHRLPPRNHRSAGAPC